MSSFTIGELVWAKALGFPFWPAAVDGTDATRIVFFPDNSYLPRDRLKVKPFLTQFKLHATPSQLNKDEFRSGVAHAVVIAIESGAAVADFGVSTRLIAILFDEGSREVSARQASDMASNEIDDGVAMMQIPSHTALILHNLSPWSYASNGFFVCLVIALAIHTLDPSHAHCIRPAAEPPNAVDDAAAGFFGFRSQWYQWRLLLPRDAPMALFLLLRNAALFVGIGAAWWCADPDADLIRPLLKMHLVCAATTAELACCALLPGPLVQIQPLLPYSSVGAVAVARVLTVYTVALWGEGYAWCVRRVLGCRHMYFTRDVSVRALVEYLLYFSSAPLFVCACAAVGVRCHNAAWLLVNVRATLALVSRPTSRGGSC